MNIRIEISNRVEEQKVSLKLNWASRLNQVLQLLIQEQDTIICSHLTMAMLLKYYDDDDAVCVNCIKDEPLREIVRAEGHDQACLECGVESVAVSIKHLAEIIDPFIRKYFCLGYYDPYRDEQQGENLNFVVAKVVKQYFGFNQVLAGFLIENDPADIRDGEEPFYASDINYEQMPIDVSHLYGQWNAILNEIRTERRFLSDRAREFFDWLFDGIENLFYEPNKDQGSMSLPVRAKLGVIQEWSAGTILFRARRADTREDYTRVVLKPFKELAPPPSKYARAGRMNAEGVTIFYGALDVETCLAEMRSSIGGYTVLGEFETTKPLRLLDLSRLDKASWDGKPLSYFQSDFDEQVTRRKFSRRLHKLISEPVIPGHEDEYLMTQVLAEYLAYVHNANFDGLLFASTQYKDGTNVVLFPKNTEAPLVNDNMSLRFSLKYVDESAKIYQTKGINYDICNVDYSLHDDEIHLYNNSYYDDDDN